MYSISILNSGFYIKIFDVYVQGRKAEEGRAFRLSAELTQFRHEAEKRLAEKDEEIESIR